MIVATKSVDVLLKGIIKTEELMFSRIESIISSMQLDPLISKPPKELFIISSDDIKKPKTRKDLALAVSTKHVNAKIMFVNKLGKDFPDLPQELFDIYSNKPNPAIIKEQIIEFISKITKKESIINNSTLEKPDDYVPDLPEEIKEEIIPPKEEIEEIEEKPISLDIKEVIKEIPIKIDEIGLAERIRKAENYASLTTIASEINAANIVREISENNASYRQTETHTIALMENITAILSNPEYDNVTALSKVRAILHDKAYLKAKTNSILEQAVESIITALVDKAKFEITTKNNAINEMVMKAFKNHVSDVAPNVRLATIIEERSKVLMDLQVLDLEIKSLATISNNTINDTISNIIADSTSGVDSPILNSQIVSRFGEIVPDNLLDTINKLFEKGQESSTEFGKLSSDVNSIIRKLYQLLALYQEESEVLSNTIRYLKAQKVEDTVVANTILKKAINLYISDGDNFDSMSMAYLIAKNHSRKSNNVLLLDITNTHTLEKFNLPILNYTQFMEDEYIHNKFTHISLNNCNAVVETDEDCQRLLTRIVFYAKHYSRVHIICTPQQQTIINNFKEEALTVNYLVDCSPNSIQIMADCINSSIVQNTAYRVILINYVGDSALICKNLDIIDRKDIQLIPVQAIPEIRYCSIHNQDPFDVNSIIDSCSLVFKSC